MVSTPFLEISNKNGHFSGYWGYRLLLIIIVASAYSSRLTAEMTDTSRCPLLIGGELQAPKPSRQFYIAPPDRVAVIALDANFFGDDSREIEDIFIIRLLQNGFRVAARSDIEQILNEIKFQNNSGLTDKDAAALGRMLNVAGVLIVSMTRNKDSRDVVISARLISVELGEVLWTNLGRECKSYPYSANAAISLSNKLAETMPVYPR